MRFLRLMLLTQVVKQVHTELAAETALSLRDMFNSFQLPAAHVLEPGYLERESKYPTEAEWAEHQLFIETIYNKLPIKHRRQINLRETPDTSRSSPYILMAVFSSKSDAIELIDRTMAMGENINSGHPTLLQALCGHYYIDKLPMSKMDFQQVIQYLLQRGADPLPGLQVIYNNIFNAATPPSMMEKHFNILEIFFNYNPQLINLKMSFNKGEPECSALVNAIVKKKPQAADFLLQQPAIDVGIVDYQKGYLGLIIQHWQEVSDTIKLPVLTALLAKGAAIYERSRGSAHREPLEAAAATQQIDMMKILLQYGADVNYNFLYYVTSPLVHALLSPGDVKKKLAAAQFLLNEGAKIDDMVFPPVGVPAIELFQDEAAYRAASPKPPISSATALYLVTAGFNDTDQHQLIKFLLDQKADPNIKSGTGDYPLHCAVTKKNFIAIQHLLDNHADPYLMNNKNQTVFDLVDNVSSPQILAFLQNHLKIKPHSIIVTMIDEFLKIEIPYCKPISSFLVFVNLLGLYKKYNFYALISIVSIAASGIYLQLTPADILNIRPLLSLISIVTSALVIFYTPIKILTQSGPSYLERLRSVGNWLISYDDSIKPQAPLPAPPEIKNLPVIGKSNKRIKRMRYPVDRKPVSLVTACRQNDLPRVKQCIEEKADLSQVENDYTALQAGCSYGCANIVEILLREENLSVNRENSQGDTALLLAARAGHWSTVILLLDYPNLKLNILHVNQQQKSLYTYAIEASNYIVIKKILPAHTREQRGEILMRILNNIRPANPVKPLNDFMESFIRNYPEQLNHQNSQHLTPLMAACHAGYLWGVEALLKESAVKKYLLDDQGRSALYHAAAQAIKLHREDKSYKRFITIIKKLIQNGAQLNLNPGSKALLTESGEEAKKVTALVKEVRIEIGKEEKMHLPREKLPAGAGPSKPPHKTRPERVKRRRSGVAASQHHPEQKKVRESKKPKQHLPPPAQNRHSQVKTDHESWANLIVEYVARLCAVNYQSFDENKKSLSNDQRAFHLYMQHSLLVYYIYRIIFIISCYDKTVSSNHRLIETGDILSMMTKSGAKSLCLWPSYEAYDSVNAISDKIATQLPPKILQSLKKAHESRNPLSSAQRRELTDLCGLIEWQSVNAVQPVGQLFIYGTKLYNLLAQFHSLRTDNSYVTEEHTLAIETFFLPAISYVYTLLAKDPDTKTDSQEVLLKGQLNYKTLKERYAHYLDLLIILFMACGDTHVNQEYISKEIVEFVHRCRQTMRNVVTHKAKARLEPEQLMKMAMEGHQLAENPINWQEAMLMPDFALVQTEVMKGLTKAGYAGRFFAQTSSAAGVPAGSGSVTECPLNLVIGYLCPMAVGL